MRYLIVGLGNIGNEYRSTRHNIGFKIVDEFVTKYRVSFKQVKYAFLSNFKYKGRTCYIIQPTLYMNNSGKSVNYWLHFYKILLSNVLIISDDISLPFGKTRLKEKGSHGGHNGLKDIEIKLGTSNYSRLRFGIGSNFRKGKQIEYVLGQFSKEENLQLNLLIEHTHKIIEHFILKGTAETMNIFNRTITLNT